MSGLNRILLLIAKQFPNYDYGRLLYDSFAHVTASRPRRWSLIQENGYFRLASTRNRCELIGFVFGHIVHEQNGNKCIIGTIKSVYEVLLLFGYFAFFHVFVEEKFIFQVDAHTNMYTHVFHNLRHLKQNEIVFNSLPLPVGTQGKKNSMYQFISMPGIRWC